YCIGDVNESNILVSDTALVTLIDTDSFQVPDPNNNVVYRCLVGKPEFTPPELQNKTFAQHDREISHDLFGLAVLVFQLLMEGTHPFSGIFQGAIEPPPYESRIVSGHFTYSQKRYVPYLPTPIAPPWEILHPSLQELFIRCFEQGHNNPRLRPSAQTWLSAIAEAEDSLITCTTNPQHRYNNHIRSCPWCERTVRLGGRDPFPSHRAIEAREHLQPRIKSRKHYTQTPRFPQRTISQQLANYWQPMTSNGSYYKPAKKSKLYPILFCLLGFGLLGYADVMIKFTQPLVYQNAYSQQTFKSPQTNNKLSFADSYQQGYTAYKDRDYDKAIANFTEAIEQEPTDARTIVNRGNARYNLKDYEGAVTDYSQALKINPNHIKALVNRGNVRYMLGQYSNDPDQEYNLAIADYNRAIGLDKNEVEAYIRRGIVRAQMAKYSGESQQAYKRAIADFTHAIKLNLSKAEAYFQRGIVYYQIAQYSSNYEQEYNLAIADFNQALTLSPKLANAYLKRGMVRYELAQYGGSESNKNQTKAVEDIQASAKIFLEQDDMDNYQQALSNLCVVVENKCDPLFQGSVNGEKTN
ncbi:MAG: tetratricopeptide repeat protein, partial [Nostoc sp.]